MPDPLSIAIAPLLKALDKLTDYRDVKLKAKEDAIRAMYKALMETKKHIELAGSSRNRPDEFTISELWMEASLKLKRVDKELSEKLQIKANYWSDGSIWSDDLVNEKEIDFNSIEQKLQKLLED